jgi:hypothetical protein
MGRTVGDQCQDGLEDQGRVHRTIKAPSSCRLGFCNQDADDIERGDAIAVSERGAGSEIRLRTVTGKESRSVINPGHYLVPVLL